MPWNGLYLLELNDDNTDEGDIIDVDDNEMERIPYN